MHDDNFIESSKDDYGSESRNQIKSLTHFLAQCAYARKVFGPEKLAYNTRCPISRCHRRALEQTQKGANFIKPETSIILGQYSETFRLMINQISTNMRNPC